MSIESDREALLTVDDDGPGIPLDFRDRIFGRFERADNSQASIGAGLGLAVSRAIIDAHNGHISFEDRPKQGTRFNVGLPIRHVKEPLQTSGLPTLLICADDPVLRQQTIASLATDYQVQCVSTIDAARRMLDQSVYQGLLLELNAPDEGGLVFAHELRLKEEFRDLPIVVMSDIESAGTQGALDIVAWVTKPIDRDCLYAAVRVATLRAGSKRPIVLHLDDDEDLLEVTSARVRTH